jgi:hypothetical protein
VERVTGIGGVFFGAHEYLNGKFASLRDPEGNVLQLWEPAGVDARRGQATDDVRTQQRIQ